MYSYFKVTERLEMDVIGSKPHQNRTVSFSSYPELELQHILNAHPGTCICIEFDPVGKYFATGSADALVSLWDVDELACKKIFTR